MKDRYEYSGEADVTEKPDQTTIRNDDLSVSVPGRNEDIAPGKERTARRQVRIVVETKRIQEERRTSEPELPPHLR